MTIVDPAEDAAGRRLIELAKDIDQGNERISTTPTTPPSGSSLAADDRASVPYQVSHAVWMALSHSSDNLHSFRVATLTGGPQDFHVVTRPYGAYPNLRAALENAATALWMLGPANRNERVTRRLRAFLADGKSKDAIVRLIGATPATTYEDRLRAATKLAEMRGLDVAACKMKPLFGDVVRDAAPHAGVKPDGAEAVWRILSGMTHGDIWSSFSLAEKDHLPETAPGVVTVRLTTSVGMLAMFTEITAQFLRRGFEILDQRQRPL